MTQVGAKVNVQPAAASGTIKTITSTGGSVTITNPSGPTTNLEVAAGGGVTSLTGDVTGTGPGATATTLVGTTNVENIITANPTVAAAAPKASPALTGVPTAPTAAPGTNTTQLATTAFGTAAVLVETNRATAAEALLAPLASPALTGSPTAPTQTAGDNTTKLATDAFVTTAIANVIAGLNPAIAVLVATTAAGDTSALTYNNGASGIGATLTGTVNTPVTIDGVLLNTLGQRLLVKNDTQSPSGAFNGIYSLTVISSVGTAPVFTRALDYDTPSDINNTGAIPVQSGTTNISTSWLLTSQVATVGTSALTYVQFSINPTKVMTTSVYDAAAISQQVLGTTATQTVTNKRITKRVLALSANSATPAINTDSFDVVHITAQTAAITSFTTNLTGTPVDGDTLRISITGTGAVALTFGTSFEASTVALPTTTVTTARLDIGFFWNTETSKWRCMASA